MPFTIFRLRTLRGANIITVLIGMALFSMFYFISLYLQRVLGFSALEAGLAYLPLSVTIILSAAGASRLVTRVGFKPTLVGGLLLVTVGLFWYSQISVDGSFLSDMLGPSILVGAGLGFSFVPVTIAAMTSTRPHEAGLASGLINTSQQLGGALGLAILVSIANSKIATFGPTAQGNPVALNDGYQLAFLVGAGFAIVGAVLATLIISSRDSREHALAAQRGDTEPVAA